MTRSLWFPALCLLVFAPREAQAEREALAVSLGQVLQVAVRQSPQLASARIDVATADARVLAASGIEDWLLQASGAYLRQRADAAEGDLTGTDRSDIIELSADATRLLPTGGTIGVHADGNRRVNVFAFLDQESRQYAASVTASLSQPLVRGRGRDVALAEQRRAAHGKTATEHAAHAAAQQLVREIVARYWELAYARRDLQIRESSLELANERRRRTQAAVELGSVAPTELIAVDQVIATRQGEIVRARTAVSQRSIELRRLAGMGIGPGQIDVSPTAPLLAGRLALEINDVLRRALAISPQLAQLRAERQRIGVDVDVAQSDRGPAVDVALSGGPLGQGNTASDALSGLASASGYQVGATLTYQQALGNRSARGAERIARHTVHSIDVAIADARADIAATVVQAVDAALAAQQRIEIGTRATKLAQDNVVSEQRRFELGRATNFDVLQRQEELKQAQLGVARATVDLLQARATIDALTGELLAKYGVSI